MKRKKIAISIIVVTALLVLVSILTNRNISIASTEELGQSLGLITLVPTVLSVILAFVTHNVLISLLIGFLSGVLILGGLYSTSIVDFPLQVLNYSYICIKDVICDIDNIEVLLLCFVVGGMIDVVRSSGGFEALAIKLTKRVNTSRKTNLLTSILGCLVFFDDYANALIVGPIMKPITDRVKVSREKLSFIVDSTAAPVSGIALVSSWMAVEVICIENGLEIVGSNANGFSLFINSIPFCFYCIFAITFVFINSIVGKDFGPMLKAEIRAVHGQPVSLESQEFDEDEKDKITNIKENMKKRIFVGIGSMLLLVLLTLVSFYIDGKNKAIIAGAMSQTSSISFKNIMTAISYASTTNLITFAAVISSIFAIMFGYLFELSTIKESLKSWLSGAVKISDNVFLLVLAWFLTETVKKLGTSYFIVSLITVDVNPIIVPILIYISCCIISCASGSFGCMFVVMPLAIPLAFKVISMGSVANDEIYLLICVGSVIAGSIFGDHCSPVTDCTILAAAGSGCSTMEHCFSQLPYTIVNCAISVICGIVLTCLGINIWIALIIGIIFQTLIMLLIGKKPI